MMQLLMQLLMQLYKTYCSIVGGGSHLGWSIFTENQ
jgi:hypothetical protein